MTKNLWVTLVSVVIVLIAMGIIAMLIFVPQRITADIESQYTPIDTSQYGYTSNIEEDKEALKDLKEQYAITAGDIQSAEKSDIYIPSNVNPFSPQEIYYESYYSRGTSGSTTSSGQSNSTNYVTSK